MRNQYSTKAVLKTSRDLMNTANIVGQTVKVAVAGRGNIVYDFTVTARNKQKGGNEITVIGHVQYSGLMQVKAKVWIRTRDGRQILGVDIHDLARQEAVARKATENEPLRW